jgi:hypothetical protein
MKNELSEQPIGSSIIAPVRETTNLVLLKHLKTSKKYQE